MLTEEMKAAGWIEHDGGRQPLPNTARVAVMFQDGQVRGLRNGGYKAKNIPWESYKIDSRWPELRIIAYRLVKSYD